MGTFVDGIDKHQSMWLMQSDLMLCTVCYKTQDEILLGSDSATHPAFSLFPTMFSMFFFLMVVKTWY